MKRLLKISLIVLSVPVLLFIIGLMLPGKVHIERSMDISSPPDSIYRQIAVLKNWPSWSPWHEIDPKMNIRYGGPDEGVGSFYTWSSENKDVGNGTLTIIASEPGKYVHNRMEFEGMGVSHSNFTLQPEGSGTRVTWSLDNESEGMNLFMRSLSGYFFLFMDGMVGKDFEKGLANLKRVCMTGR
jgi:hypothetical protein